MKAILLPALALAILATMPACSTTPQPTYAAITSGTVLKQSGRIHAGYYVSSSGRIIPFCLPDWGWPVHLNIRRYTHDWDHHHRPASNPQNPLANCYWRRNLHSSSFWFGWHWLLDKHRIEIICQSTHYSYSWSSLFLLHVDNICHSNLPSSL